jgi:hypothetical protein|tara:strand:+ start:236 stop:544 length:309 start_codon:yes stop_codon:yes gene_type:complete
MEKNKVDYFYHLHPDFAKVLIYAIKLLPIKITVHDQEEYSVRICSNDNRSKGHAFMIANAMLIAALKYNVKIKWHGSFIYVYDNIDAEDVENYSYFTLEEKQ